MSFPRAKIYRFNDVNPCTPSPAEYNLPTISAKPKCAVIPQSDRFPELKTSSLSDNGSVKSTPCFRTPTITKYKKVVRVPSATKPKTQELFSNSDAEALREKIVECENKDLFIKELTEQMEELTEKMCNLQRNIQEINQEKLICEDKIQKINEEYEQSKTEMTQQFTEKLQKLQDDKDKITNELTKLQEEYSELLNTNATLKEDVESKHEEIKNCQATIAELKNEHKMKIEKMEMEHMHEIEDVEFEILKTMTELEKEKQQCNNRIQEIEVMMDHEIAKLKAGFQAEKEQILMETNGRLQMVEENFKKVSEAAQMEFNEKLTNVESTWEQKFIDYEKVSEAILKECQAISEYNIIQSELEKNEIISNLNEKTTECDKLNEKFNTIKNDYKEMETKYKDLQTQFSKIIIELNETREQLEEKQAEIKNLLNKKRTYEITINTSQETIEVLKRRLINSDRDVEQLKEELTSSEEKFVDYETKFSQLKEELKETQKINADLERQYEIMFKMTENEIQETKAELIQKVQDYKSKVDNYSKKLNDEKELFNEVFQQLQEQKDVNRDAFELINVAKEELDGLHKDLQDYYIKEKLWNNTEEEFKATKRKLEEIINEKDNEIGDLTRQLLQLQEKCESYCHHFEYFKSKVSEYEKDVDDTDNIHKKYIEQSGKYDNLLQKYEQLENEHLEYTKEKYEELLNKFKRLEQENVLNKNKIEEQQNLIGPFRKQLEAFELERETLVNEKEFMAKEVNEVSMKYAEILGHQNNKQKIKHLRDIKMKNEELVQNKLDLEAKLRGQLKVIEKLKKENSDLKKNNARKFKSVDKENISSPNRSMNSSNRIESPGPLRERN